MNVKELFKAPAPDRQRQTAPPEDGEIQDRPGMTLCECCGMFKGNVHYSLRHCKWVCFSCYQGRPPGP